MLFVPQIKLYQLTRLLHDHYIDLFNHFDTHEISPTLYAAPWFLTLFASQFPLGFVARVFGESIELDLYSENLTNLCEFLGKFCLDKLHKDGRKKLDEP